jgi:NAD(P)-dependent dehydrogenase (short-subunit alcohol dehydrogenase family)
MAEFAGQVAWVTGARGAIGRAVVAALAAEGARVFASSRDAGALDRLADEWGDAVRALPLDVTDRNAVDGAAAAIVSAAGRLDLLVNSTTAPIFGDFLALADADWEAVLEAKFFGYMRTMRAVLPQMEQQGGGAIVNVSGRGGHQPSSPAHLPGSAANAAVDVLTKGLANIYGPRGVRINAVAPGPIESERFARIAAANALLPGSPRTAGSPLGMTGRPEDVAAAVTFLASARARHITGIVLQVDGGGTASL